MQQTLEQLGYIKLTDPYPSAYQDVDSVFAIEVFPRENPTITLRAKLVENGDSILRLCIIEILNPGSYGWSPLRECIVMLPDRVTFIEKQDFDEAVDSALCSAFQDLGHLLDVPRQSGLRRGQADKARAMRNAGLATAAA